MRRATPLWAPHLVLVLAQLSFSTMHVVSKPALAHIPPIAFAAMRVLLATPLLAFVAARREPAAASELLTARWLSSTGAVCGLLGVLLPQSLIYVGIDLAGVNIAAMAQPTIPVYVAAYGMATGLEAFHWSKVAGIGSAVAGALALLHVDVLLTGAGPPDPAVLAGSAVMILQTGSYAAYLILLQRVLAAHPSPFTIHAVASAWGGAAIAGLAVALPGQARSVEWAAVPASAWGALLYSGVVVSAGAHGLLAWAVGEVAAVTPALYVCLQPLLTAVLGAAVLGQAVGARDVAAMGLILAGLAAVVAGKLREGGGAQAPERRTSKPEVGGDQLEMLGLLPAADEAASEGGSDSGRRLQCASAMSLAAGDHVNASCDQVDHDDVASKGSSSSV